MSWDAKCGDFKGCGFQCFVGPVVELEYEAMDVGLNDENPLSVSSFIV